MNENYEDGQDEKFKKDVWLEIWKELIKEKKLLLLSCIISCSQGILEVASSFFTKYIIDTFVVNKNIEAIWYFSMLAVGIVLATLILTFFYVLASGSLEIKLCHNLRIKVFNKYQLLSLSFYDTHAVGHLMARLSSDINKLSNVISWSLTDLLWELSIFIFTIIAMLILNVKLTIIALAITPMIIFASKYINKKVLKQNRLVSKLNSQIIATYNEDIQGVLTAKTLNRELINDEDFDVLTSKMKKASIRATRVMVLLPFIILTISSLGSFLVTFLGGNFILQNVITIGTFVAFTSLLTQLMDPISWLAGVLSEFISAQASVERVCQVFKEEVEISDSDEAKKLYGNFEVMKEVLKGDVEFKNVSFQYKEGEPVLKDFNLKVKQGETIALVGATGAGKSTIVNLFCHFYLPTTGTITMGGYDYNCIPQKWIYDNLGYVLQSPHLFTGSIIENIRYGNVNASDDEIKHALKLVGMSDFIESLKDGYETQLGEDGAILSTGQKQLLSLARILVRNPKFFVLDEATSYIDTETEQIVQKAVELTLSGRTSFVIAHRLSTIRTASKIIVIDKGNMLEMGTHEELLKKKGAYYEFYKKQFIGSDGEF
ncbi:MAG: ABC transporter ATP-binding protein [Treponema sp.]